MPLFSIQRHSLRTRDEVRTKASELTLRQSIYPLCLVTTLFLLWVRSESLLYTQWPLIDSQGFSYGLLDTLNKHFQIILGISRARSSGLQAAYFGKDNNLLLRFAGVKTIMPVCWLMPLRGISTRISWPCQLDPPPFRIQGCLHLGSLPVRHRRSCRVAMPPTSLVRRFLRGHLRDWKRARVLGDCS